MRPRSATWCNLKRRERGYESVNNFNNEDNFNDDECMMLLNIHRKAIPRRFTKVLLLRVHEIRSNQSKPIAKTRYLKALTRGLVVVRCCWTLTFTSLD